MDKKRNLLSCLIPSSRVETSRAKTALIFLTSLFGGALSFVALAPMASANIVEQINQVTSQLSKMNNQSANCDIGPVSLQCELQSQCSQMKNSELYLYKDSQGYALQNGAMMTALAALDSCAEKQLSSQNIKDPFLFPRQFMDVNEAGGRKQLAENKVKFSQAANRAQKIFEEARSKMVRVLESRRSAQNSKSIDSLLARVKSVKFEAQKITEEKELFKQGCEFANAAYQPLFHTVLVCPQFLNMPESTLLFTFAHEIAHAISPCSAAFEMSDNGIVYPDWALKGFGGDEPKYSAVKGRDYPFNSVVQCLQGNQSMGIKLPSKEGVLAQINREKNESIEYAQSVEEGRPTDGISAQYDEKLDILSKNYSDYASCEMISGSGHLEEAVADWFGSQVIADKIGELKNPAAKKEYAFLASGAQLSLNGCQNAKQSAVNMMKAAAKGKNCAAVERVANYLNNIGPQESSHPSSDKRVGRVIFAQPVIKEALGCSGGSRPDFCK